MELSIFLARVIGLYLLTVAEIFLFRGHSIKGALKEMNGSKGLMAFSGAISLLLGLAIIIAHPVYDLSWRVVITLLGYLAIFQGITRLAFTNEMQSFVSMVMHRYLWVVILILFLLGSFLCYAGFIRHGELID